MASGNRKIKDIFAPKSKGNSNKDIVTTTTTDVSSSSSSFKSNQSESGGEIPFRPHKSFVFPKTKIGERNRSCQHQWFEKFPWLHYDSTLVFFYLIYFFNFFFSNSML